MAENLTYTHCGDYYIPDIKLSYTESIEWNRFSRRAHTYLKEHRPILYNDQVLSEQLFPYLKEISETAMRRMEQLEADLLKANPAVQQSVLADAVLCAAERTGGEASRIFGTTTQRPSGATIREIHSLPVEFQLYSPM